MITPLKINVQVCERLLKLLKDHEASDMTKTISINSKLVEFHANNLIDHRTIQSGKLVPTYCFESISETI